MQYCTDCGEMLYQIEFSRGICGTCHSKRTNKYYKESDVKPNMMGEVVPCTDAANYNNEITVFIPTDAEMLQLLEYSVDGRGYYDVRQWNYDPAKAMQALWSALGSFIEENR